MRMFVGASVFVGAMLAAACADELAEGAGEMLVDAGHFLADAGSDSASAQSDGGAPKSETVELACDKTWTRTTRVRRANLEQQLEEGNRIVTTYYYAELPASGVVGVDAWKCGHVVSGGLPSCDSKSLECLESEQAPVVDCESATVQLTTETVRVLCGSETQRSTATLAGNEYLPGPVVADRWMTTRVTIRR